MNAHVPPPSNVVRLPPRLRVVPVSSALDRLHTTGTLDDRQHAAGLAYRELRRWYEAMNVSVKVRRLHLWEEQRDALKRDHAAMLRAAGAERFALDRLCLDDDPPLRCEVERVRAALGRVAGQTSTA